MAREPSSRVSSVVALALAVAAVAATASRLPADPVAAPTAVVTAPGVRFTVLTESLIRLEHATAPAAALAPVPTHGDDRATSVVINRRVEPVPAFAVAKVNATAITITTKRLRLTYNAPAHLLLPPAAHPVCNCTGAECTTWASGKPVVWPVHSKTQGGDGTRTPSCPNGLTNKTLTECFCACQSDSDCTAITYAPPGEDLAKSCWLLMDVSKTASVGDRVFAGLLAGGPSKGFTDDNLMIEMLAAGAPTKTWRPSMAPRRNLNGSYPNLDCCA